MAKKKIDKNPELKPIRTYKIVAILKNETLHFIIGLVMVIFSVYLLLAFSSFFFTGSADQSILENHTTEQLLSTDNHVKNYAGARGAQLADYLINGCFGISSFFIIVFLAVAGMKLMKAYQFHVWKWFICCSLLLVWFSVLFGFTLGQTFNNSFIYPGGLHGYNVSNWLVSQIGTPGVWLLLLITALCFFIYLSTQTIIVIRKAMKPSFLRKKKKTSDEKTAESTEEPEESIEITDPQPQTVTFTETYVQQPKETTNTLPEADDKDGEDWIEINKTESKTAPEPVASTPQPEKKEPEVIIETGGSDDDGEYTGPSLEPYNPKLDLENYRYPGLDLMKRYENNEPTINMEEQNTNKNRIINILRSFGIEINTIKATVGPTITLYEITPESGVRISKIRGLEDDIALSLKALGIRIIAPIPGKGTIGIEVPNSDPKIVSMQSVIGSKKFQESTYDLPIAFGKTITNEVFMVDLCKMPHVLVAGATGQGKSVGLNAIITSLLYKKHPAELKFVLIDPKKVEFSIYSTIENHFLAKLPDGEEAIITDFKKVINTLNSLCIEMDTRYDLLKKAHVRNIKEYNEKFVNRKLNPEKGHKYMPYIVVIIDEFGDLIMTAGKEVELPIARIAQLARAIGIHMIIATQRPTTNIITGTIKANFPARVAFRVSSMMDSRTILDRPGANQLVGRGDMLFLQGADPVRVQCAFVDTPEVEQITDYINHQQGYPTAFMLPEYVGEEGESSSIGEVDMNRLDPLFEEAARLIVIHQQGSTSLIQRKFSIGYNRAGRLMDQLEKAGIVGPTQGSKAREVLCLDENDLEMRLNNLQQ